MTHRPESEVEEEITRWFRNIYGEENVETQSYLGDPRWFCDIVVDVDFARLYIEVENDEDSVRSGVAQAIGYAATDPLGIPMVVVPEGHTEPIRQSLLEMSSGVLIREFNMDENEFVR